MSKYNKLVRDKIPEILDKKDILYEKRVANEDEYKQELIKKLAEETKEFQSDPCSAELADVLEVVMALQELSEFSDTEEVRRRKREDRGAFDKKIILKGEK